MTRSSKAPEKTKMVILRLPSTKLRDICSIPPRPSIGDGDTAQQDATSKQVDSTPAASSKTKKAGQSSAKKRAPPSIDPTKPLKKRAPPKKKAQADNGNGTKPNGVSSHRPNPKANTGAINANLRALDRSGKPCRRWERKPMQIKSFTGHTWQLETWKGNPRVKSNDNSASPDLGNIEMQGHANNGADSPADHTQQKHMNGKGSPFSIAAQQPN
ncbi:hypothetical protein K470DRAFT_260012 [Piedraia hortae CBS 480.64]|uniref:DUF1711-domain-containing protein n=1 Tax=Piedraia hortae CBS 480.64 TaxID=1314780 RepID=A0A6A7BT04_9PEZI|nr:hypothetical protein K470DRAFT_260012 [Piedraia hortae CBS 480.64]